MKRLAADDGMCSEVGAGTHTVESCMGAAASTDTCYYGFRWCPADETSKTRTREVLLVGRETYGRAYGRATKAWGQDRDATLQEEVPPETLVSCGQPETP